SSSYCLRPPLLLHPVPTRRSSDLTGRTCGQKPWDRRGGADHCVVAEPCGQWSGAYLLGLGFGPPGPREDHVRGVSLAIARANERDRKSTRLNSSHGSNSYDVFCLK